MPYQALPVMPCPHAFLGQLAEVHIFINNKISSDFRNFFRFSGISSDFLPISSDFPEFLCGREGWRVSTTFPSAGLGTCEGTLPRSATDYEITTNISPLHSEIFDTLFLHRSIPHSTTCGIPHSTTCGIVLSS